jgi:hypothetical protein
MAWSKRCAACGRRGGQRRGIRGVVARYHWGCWCRKHRLLASRPVRALDFMYDLRPDLFSGGAEHNESED